jgi:hypothetical protein
MAYFKENEEKIVKMQAGIKGYNTRKKMNAQKHVIDANPEKPLISGGRNPGQISSNNSRSRPQQFVMEPRNPYTEQTE